VSVSYHIGGILTCLRRVGATWILSHGRLDETQVTAGSGGVQKTAPAASVMPRALCLEILSVNKCTGVSQPVVNIGTLRLSLQLTEPLAEAVELKLSLYPLLLLIKVHTGNCLRI
jgi:hypothetical protein